MKFRIIYSCKNEGCSNIYEEEQEGEVIRQQRVLCMRCAKRMPGFKTGCIYGALMSMEIKIGK